MIISRPFGKELTHANALCSPHHFLQNTRTNLQALAGAHSTPQSLSLRAGIVLRAADIDTPTNLQIGCDLGCTNRTVGKWQRRFVALGLSGLQDAAPSGRPRTIVSSTRVQVISVASALPKEQDRPVTRWTLDEIVGTLLDALPTPTISRSSVWRILHDIDLKPHTSEYWLNSHDEHFDTKAARFVSSTSKRWRPTNKATWSSVAMKKPVCKCLSESAYQTGATRQARAT